MRPHRAIATAAAAAGLLAACGTGTGGGGGDPTVVATTTMLGDVVANLVGDLAAVEVVMPVNADPHEFQPSARQAAAIREADLVVANGGGFEAGLEDTLAGARDDGAVVFEAVDHVPLLRAGDPPEDEDSDGEAGGEGDGHGATDPHVFTDPARMATVTEALAGVLADEIPALDTATFREQAAEEVAALRELDAEVEDTLAVVPPERRKLVTNHDVLAYFADRYGFEVIGAVIPTTTTQSAASAAQIDRLAAIVAAEGVPAVFTDTSSPDDLAATLADEVGDVAVVELYSESLGEPGSGADTYAGMVRTNAARIADALAP